MLNKTSYYLEKKALIDYSIMTLNKKTRKMAIPFFIYCMIVSLFICLMALTGSETEFYWYLAMFVIVVVDVMGLLLIIKPDLRTKRVEKRSNEELKYFSPEECFETVIKNTEICIRKSKHEKRYHYNEIKRVEIFKNSVFIFLTPKLVIILDKHGFEDSSWRECENLFRENEIEVRNI